jgi:excisionase family DNA binding protein
METLEIPALLSVQEAAAHLRISKATAYRLIAAGEVPAVRVGGQLRVDRDELREYLYAGRDAA